MLYFLLNAAKLCCIWATYLYSADSPEWVFPNVESIFRFSYQICEFMYERELRYDKIIGCYLHDPVRKVSKSGASGFFIVVQPVLVVRV